MPREARPVTGWSAPLLLIGMVLTSASTLAATEWTDELEAMPLVGIVGLVAGLLLSLSAFGGWFSHLLSGVYGVAWVGFLMGQGLPGDLGWRERILEIGARVDGWARQAFSGGKSQDALIFSIFLGILLWCLAHLAAWNTYRRRRAWLAAVPPGIVCVVAAHFYIGEARLIRNVGFYLLLSLVYVGRAHTFKQQEIWHRQRVAYSPALGMAVVRSSLVLALLVLAVAWALPSTSSASTSASELWDRINSPWETIEEEWQRLFSSVHSGEAHIAEPFASSLALEGACALDEDVVLDVRAPRDGQYYWRAAVYATYTGSRWDPPDEDVVGLPPGEQAVAVLNDVSRHPITQTVTNYLPGRRLLVGASQVMAVSREAEATARTEGSLPLAFHRLTSVQPLGAGEPYTVTSRVSHANAAELRGSGIGYPEWMPEVYLQLPRSLPERVHTLAQRITSVADNPYDKARLLEQYLRDTISYDLNPPAVPQGRDYVDFLLFESQRAYCNGYATAMAVMVRSLGIPARLATGYAEGQYDDQLSAYRVRENNAHSWPEVYFPSYGWIEFEPTVSQSALDRPDPEREGASELIPPSRTDPGFADDLRRAEEGPSPILEDGNGAAVDRGLRSQRAPRWARVGTSIALTALAAAGWWAASRLVDSHRSLRFPPVERIYGRLLRFGRWLGHPLRVPDTPLEWAQDLGAVVPKADESITQIAGIYAETRFGGGRSRDPAAEIAWRQARAQLWGHLLWGQWLGRLGFPSARDRTDT